MDTYEVAVETMLAGGGTWQSRYGRTTSATFPYEPEICWIVARLPSAPFSNTIHALTGDDHDLLSQLQKIIWDFLVRSHDGGMFGTWLEKGEDGTRTLHIDHVVVTTQTEAERLGRRLGEKAIYNAYTGDTVYL